MGHNGDIWSQVADGLTPHLGGTPRCLFKILFLLLGAVV